MGRTFENRRAAMEKSNGAKVKLYSKFSKEIFVCAKAGGTTIEGNAALAHLVDRAKRAQVPGHVIDKAIDKAKGGGGEDFSRSMYEGYGPGGCVVMVECLTDNPNRTISDVRNCFTKCKTKVGAPGSVAYMFDHLAIFSFKGDDEDAILEILMMADVDVNDVVNEGGIITVFAPHTEYNNVKTALTEAIEDIKFEVDEVTYEPQTSCELSGDDAKMFEKFTTMLNDCEDVQEIYHNAEVV